MVHNFRMRLTLIILVFSLIVSFSVAFLNFQQMESLVEKEHMEKILLIEETVVNSLESIDAAYALFDMQIIDRVAEMDEQLSDYRSFNFLITAQELVSEHSSLNAIRIYNPDGSIVEGTENIERASKIEETRQSVFELAANGGETQEVKGQWQGEEAFYRYIPYTAVTEQGVPVQRVIEMVRNNKELDEISIEYKQNFIWSLLLILAMALIVSFIIAHWLARPIYLAFHDSLTGLKNRAAFDNSLKAFLQKKGSKPVLMMMDLDNFKLVNDYLGHDGGDGFLMRTAAIIQHHAGKEIVAARLGGDEFAVIFPEADQALIEETASLLIREMRTLMLQGPGTDAIDVTVSIGIAFGQDHDDAETLYKKADMALYESKNYGKNQYRFFTGDAINV